MSPGSRRTRAGVALIEVIVALVILAIAGTGLVAVLGQTMASVRQLHGSEDSERMAARLVDRAAAWSRAELDVHVGATRTGRFVLGVQLIAPSLFALEVSDTTGYVYLRTAAYRPDSAGVERD